ncbi:hypothetical protein CALVIDRAFT_456347, partial [Calocera viscosa TUFC12733]
PAATAAVQLDDEVLNRCEESFRASDQDRRRSQAKNYAVHGIIGIVCRHDIPLFVANLTDPGERHHYTVALLRKVMQQLPPTATLGVLYDIGCQLDRAIRKHGYMPELIGRISWATSVLHAYGHQWACQLTYHPRKRIGFGLTNGEGCERVWAWMSDLIPTERLMAHHRRLFALEGHLQHLGLQHRLTLGRWLDRQLKQTQLCEQEALGLLRKCGFTEPALPLLVDIHKHLDLVSRIQQQQPEVVSLAEQLGILRILNSVRDQVQKQDVPYLTALSRCLVLKEQVVSRLVGRNFEFDIINRYKRGHDEEGPSKGRLGTTGIVKVQEKIVRRDAACRRAIQKYNTAAAALRDLEPRPTWATIETMPALITPQQAMDTTVDADIWYLLWFDATGSPPPLWFSSETARKGIRMLLQRDRCSEEHARLLEEAQHLKTWLQELLQAALAACQSAPSTFIHSALIGY